MFVTIINDCNNGNDFGRQATRVANLFNVVPVTIGVNFGFTLEGAGNLIDVLDASEGKEGIILVNLAPRQGEGKKWENGTPFCYFYYGKTLIISSVQGFTLSLIKKLQLAKEVFLLDIPTVICKVVELQLLQREVGNSVVTSQFRSYEFLPRVAKWIWDGVVIPSTKYSLDNFPDAPSAVWLVDGFGNCKTTILPEDITFKPGEKLDTKIGKISCYQYLKDVPNDTTAIIIGSSGIEDKRFIELVIQGKSAAGKYALRSGSIII